MMDITIKFRRKPEPKLMQPFPEVAPFSRKAFVEGGYVLVKVLKFVSKVIIPIATLVAWQFIVFTTHNLNPIATLTISIGMGFLLVWGSFWVFKRNSAIKHEVWCKGRKECGE